MISIALLLLTGIELHDHRSGLTITIFVLACVNCIRFIVELHQS